jgi:hypothetical protein
LAKSMETLSSAEGKDVKFTGKVGGIREFILLEPQAPWKIGSADVFFLFMRRLAGREPRYASQNDSMGVANVHYCHWQPYS